MEGCPCAWNHSGKFKRLFLPCEVVKKECFIISWPQEQLKNIYTQIHVSQEVFISRWLQCSLRKILHLHARPICYGDVTYIAISAFSSSIEWVLCEVLSMMLAGDMRYTTYVYTPSELRCTITNNIIIITKIDLASGLFIHSGSHFRCLNCWL